MFVKYVCVKKLSKGFVYDDYNDNGFKFFTLKKLRIFSNQLVLLLILLRRSSTHKAVYIIPQFFLIILKCFPNAIVKVKFY